MFNLRFISVLSLAVFATATPLFAKRDAFGQDLVNLYTRTDPPADDNKNSSAVPPPPADDNKKNTAPPPPADDNKNNTAPPPPADGKNNGKNDGKNNDNNNGTLNDYGGLQSMKGFDDFYGSGNFDGSKNGQVIIVQEQQTVCQVQQIEIIQQKLIILQEMATRIVTELVCEVETQTIVVEQLKSGLIAFQQDVQRQTVKKVGFDKNIASLSSKIINEDGSFNLDDLNFKGSDVGNNTVVVSGDNWNDSTSPDSVQKALDAAKDAHHDSTPDSS